MRTRFDEIGKQIVEAAIEAGGEVAVEHHIVGPGLDVDIWFQPDPERVGALDRAGLLGRMAAAGPCMIEPYRNTPGVAEMQTCICKQYMLQQASMREARHGSDAEAALRPWPMTRLWVVSSGRPETILRSYELEAMAGWPRGCYSARLEIDARHVVVVRELPPVRETLLLRLLGRGPTFQGALAEFEALPEDAWERQLAMPVLVAFCLRTPQDSEEQDMPSRLQQSRAIYAEWEARIKREGLEAGLQAGERAVVLRQLTRRFGPLPDAAVARVERAGLAELERFADRLLTAESLDAVLAD